MPQRRAKSKSPPSHWRYGRLSEKAQQPHPFHTLLLSSFRFIRLYAKIYSTLSLRPCSQKSDRIVNEGLPTEVFFILSYHLLSNKEKINGPRRSLKGWKRLCVLALPIDLNPIDWWSTCSNKCVISHYEVMHDSCGPESNLIFPIRYDKCSRKVLKWIKLCKE